MLINLPKAVASYFAAERNADAGEIARCFTPTGIVRDEGRTFMGAMAIEQWNHDTRARYHHSVIPLSATERDGAIVVIGKVSGDFPGSPVHLQHVFRLYDEKIVSLEIR
jgi:hypothetical protein